MTLAWHGCQRVDEVVHLGPLALMQPLLEQLDLAGIIDRHLLPDPQREFSHGSVLSLLLAARLCQPTALSQLATWATRSDAEFLWDVPTDKRNDDRLGRAKAASNAAWTTSPRFRPAWRRSPPVCSVAMPAVPRTPSRGR